MEFWERSFAEIAQEIVKSLQQIIRLEIKLAKAEAGESLRSARQGAVLLIAGGVAMLYAVGCVILAAIYALTLVVTPWAAALIVAAVTAVAGGLGLYLAIQKFNHVGIPKRTVASLQEMVS